MVWPTHRDGGIANSPEMNASVAQRCCDAVLHRLNPSDFFSESGTTGGALVLHNKDASAAAAWGLDVASDVDYEGCVDAALRAATYGEAGATLDFLQEAVATHLHLLLRVNKAPPRAATAHLSSVLPLAAGYLEAEDLVALQFQVGPRVLPVDARDAFVYKGLCRLLFGLESPSLSPYTVACARWRDCFVALLGARPRGSLKLRRGSDSVPDTYLLTDARRNPGAVSARYCEALSLPRCLSSSTFGSFSVPSSPVDADGSVSCASLSNYNSPTATAAYANPGVPGAARHPAIALSIDGSQLLVLYRFAAVTVVISAAGGACERAFRVVRTLAERLVGFADMCGVNDADAYDEDEEDEASVGTLTDDGAAAAVAAAEAADAAFQEPLKASAAEGAGGAKTQYQEHHRIVVVGAGSVGKSAISVQYVQGTFVSDYDPNICDTYKKQDKVGSVNCLIEVVDMAGQEEYAALRQHYYQNGDGFLAVYSVTDHGTLTELQQQYQDLLLERNGIPSPTVLVGNKTDLGCGDDDTGVPSNLGERVAQEYFGAVPFLETSAKLHHNISEAFHELIHLIRASKGLGRSASNTPAVPPPPRRPYPIIDEEDASNAQVEKRPIDVEEEFDFTAVSLQSVAGRAAGRMFVPVPSPQQPLPPTPPPKGVGTAAGGSAGEKVGSSGKLSKNGKKKKSKKKKKCVIS